MPGLTLFDRTPHAKGGVTPVRAQHMATAPSNPIPLLGSKANRRRKSVGRLGPWHLLQRIGEGTLTRVYLARPLEQSGDTLTAEGRFDGAYAVKSLRKEWWSEPLAIEAQRREAWVGQRVSHPNLVPILSSSVAAPPFYVVMPYLSGRSASQLVDEGQLSLPMALWIARQAAEGLSALHRTTGMIHGDLKPANLHVAQDGHTTLLDFGFCQTVEEARSWEDHPVVGTPRYLAPERFTSVHQVDPRSDLYSLGVTLYELLAGVPPYLATEPAELVEQHLTERPRPLGELREGLPESVGGLVQQLLAKDPLRRPADAAEVADRLRRLEIECFGLR